MNKFRIELRVQDGWSGLETAEQLVICVEEGESVREFIERNTADLATRAARRMEREIEARA